MQPFTGTQFSLRAAQLPGDSQIPSEDRIFTARDAVVVLDGATQAFPLERGGGWLADELGRRLVEQLDSAPSAGLKAILRRTLQDLVDVFNLVPGLSPSATVSIVRCRGGLVEVLVLCDSPVVVKERSGTLHIVRDSRLEDLREGVQTPKGLRDSSDPAWIEVIQHFESLRNQPAGFWVASASPEAADHAVTASFVATDLSVVVVATDGAAAGVDQYDIYKDWNHAVDHVANSPAEFLERVHALETSDPDAMRWQRAKVHDDKAIAVLDFERHRPASEFTGNSAPD